MTALRRLGRFILVMFKPQVYATYAILWVLALEGSAVLLDHGSWRPSWSTLVRAASVLLALLYLRMVDEQKDVDYDREHHPDRPLVTGDITAAELGGAMALIVILLVALNAWLSVASLAVLLLDLAYAVFLVTLERRSDRIRDGLFLNLLVTYPVQLLLSVYVFVSTGLPVRASTVPLIAIFVCVFLHFEFARKTAWVSAAGARLYSAALGPLGSARWAAGFAVGAAVLTLALFRPWRHSGVELLAALLPYTALAFPLAGFLRFVRRRPAAWPAPLAMGFVVSGYLTLALQAGVS